MDEAPNSRFSGHVHYLFTSSRNGKNYKITKKKKKSAWPFYAISDRGGDCRVDQLSVQKVLIGMFLLQDLEKLIACCQQGATNKKIVIITRSSTKIQNIVMVSKKLLIIMYLLICESLSLANCLWRIRNSKYFSPHQLNN